MATLDEMSQVELLQLQKDLQAEYDKLKGLNLNLDMSRGKPAGAHKNFTRKLRIKGGSRLIKKQDLRIHT